MPPAALTFLSHIVQTTSCFLASSASGPVSASGAPSLITSAALAGAESASARTIAPAEPAVVTCMIYPPVHVSLRAAAKQSLIQPSIHIPHLLPPTLHPPL